MTQENDRYDKIVRVLKNSRPELPHPEEIENEVIGRIQRYGQRSGTLSDFIESLFSWVYIGWVRRSLIGVSVVLVAIFVYQQAFIFREVKNISRKVVITGNAASPFASSTIDKRLMLYKMSTKISPEADIRISESQLEDLLKSYNDLQVKYKDLLKIIEENPELRKYIENKLNEERNRKPDI